jgi:prepilin-type N-terminal cleavage/methylation domain-containing protein
MFKKLLNKRNQSGFTIIEVMIVLAIAGLILVVVLIAVPQLQRNQRNSSRTADATRTAASVSNIIANKKGVAFAATDLTTLNEDLGSLSQYTAAQVTFGNAASVTNPSSIVIRSGAKCDPSGNGTAIANAGRTFVVLYATEDSNSTSTTNGTPQCVES